MLTSPITSDHESGGTHTSRTIMLKDLQALLSAYPQASEPSEFGSAIKEENVLGKGTESSRQRSFRYLKELYLLDRSQPLFRALSDLWPKDESAQPLIALNCALARDPLLRATADVITSSAEGALITSDDLGQAVQKRYPESYSESVASKIGRNAASSWTQSGHLSGKTKRQRTHVSPRPASVAFALFVGHLNGGAGRNLFDTLWAQVLDSAQGTLTDLASAAAQRGWIEFKQAGGLTEIGFRWLTRVDEGAA